VKAEEYEEREEARKIFLPISLVMGFIPYIILDQGCIRKEDALNNQ